MKKFKPEPQEVIDIDDFINRYKSVKGDFDYFKEYNSRYADHPDRSEKHQNKIYRLIAHDTNIISQHSRTDTRHEFTAKGLEVYEHEGYDNWQKYNDDLIKFVRENPQMVRDSVDISKKTSIGSFMVGLFGLVFIIASFFKDNYIQKQLEQRISKVEQLYNDIPVEPCRPNKTDSIFEKNKGHLSKSSQDTTLSDKGKK